MNELKMVDLMLKLWPLNRSITGKGLRETLRIISDFIGEMQISEIPSGQEVYDWRVPKEWEVVNAYIVTPDGNRICDFSTNNLHLVGYSTPFKGKLSLGELQEHLYSLPEQPDAIPYVTSYYKSNWGFCISHRERAELVDGVYNVVVETKIFDGYLSYGEVVIPGCSEEEIFLSTYVCHPSMANNELSGPVVSAYLAKWVKAKKHRRFTYRFVFLPETIGSITYIHENIDHLKEKMVAGYNLTCLGDERSVGYLSSRNGKTLSDKAAVSILNCKHSGYKVYDWNDRGSDERQYCSPGVDLPVASIFRSKYGEYPEYHTSLDTIGRVVTERGLNESLVIYKEVIEALELNFIPLSTFKCEPFLSKRNLYPSTSMKGEGSRTSMLMNVLSNCDGTKDLFDLADTLKVSIHRIHETVSTLLEHGLVESISGKCCSYIKGCFT